MKNPTSKLLTIALLGVFLACFSYQQAAAQFSIGASYEIRSHKPTNGFGVRIENDMPLKVPMLAIGVRAQFSNFSEKNNISGINDITYDQKLSHYNLGLMALLKLKLGLLEPYVGLGLGTSHLKVKSEGLSQSYSENKNSIYYEGALGAEVSLLPILHPFIEYRLHRNNFNDVIQGYKTHDTNGIWAFGLSLTL